MSRGPATPYEDALRAVVSLLDGLPGPGMIIGGLAVIAHGHVRTTEDIDVTVSGASVTRGAVIDVAARHGIRSRIDDPVAFAERTQVLLLVHEPSGVEIDLSLAWIPFEEDALTRQQFVPFRGTTIRVCHPEDLIVYKLVAARALDLEDARQLVLRHGTLTGNASGGRWRASTRSSKTVDLASRCGRRSRAPRRPRRATRPRNLHVARCGPRHVLTRMAAGSVASVEALGERQQASVEAGGDGRGRTIMRAR